MDPRKIPFNALIVGPTNSGKTKYILNQIRGPFRGKFDYIVLICPTFVFNKTYDYFADNEPRIYVINCQQHEMEAYLFIASFFFEKTNTLIILDDCAALKEVRRRTSQLVNLGFSARHSGLSVWVLTQQMTSIAKPFKGKCSSYRAFLHPLEQNNKGHLRRLCWRRRVQRFCRTVKRRQIFPPCILSALSIWDYIWIEYKQK